MLKRLIFIMCMVLTTLANAEKHEFSSPLELSEFFKDAHESRNYDSISSIINWDGVGKPMKKKVEVYTTANFGLKINGITIEEVEKGAFKKILLGDNNIMPNLFVSHRMKIHFDIGENDPASTGKDTAVYLIGQKGEQYRIAVYIKEVTSSKP